MKKDYSSKSLHEVLRQIVDQFGQEIVGEQRLRGMICDYLPDDVTSIKIMSRAVNDHLGEKLLLLQGLDDSDFELQLSNIRQSFQEDNFLRHGIADYVVNCFLYSLEWTDEIPEYDDLEGCRESGELSFVQSEDGSEYCGNLDTNNERSGFGVERQETSYYAGEWRLNLRHGIGIEVDAKKNKYAGEWSINRPKGIGMKVYTNGSRYAGEWKNGKPQGPGILFLPDGKCICGQFQHGLLKKSYGICYLKDNSYIIGEMTENGPHGLCKHYFPEGHHEMEEWENGQKIVF